MQQYVVECWGKVWITAVLDVSGTNANLNKILILSNNDLVLPRNTTIQNETHFL